jgi:hypothetical protein
MRWGKCVFVLPILLKQMLMFDERGANSSYNYGKDKTQPRASISSNKVNNPAPPNSPILELNLKISIKNPKPSYKPFTVVSLGTLPPQVSISFMFNSRLTEKLTNSETGDHLIMAASP